jgi:hypothetical protein
MVKFLSSLSEVEAGRFGRLRVAELLALFGRKP